MHVCPQCFGLFAAQAKCPRDGTELVHYMDVLVGLQLGPYIVGKKISEGGMGVVYAAEHPALGRQVAIKVLRPELSIRDDIVARFVQEARSVNTIGHRNIVNIYDFGKTPFGSFYIVMEYLEGTTLRAVLERDGPLSAARVGWILRETGVALAAAHAKGFIHRDVKPANIMVGRRAGSEFLKLLDFGIAKLFTDSTQSETGETLGTPRYMSPEQLDAAPYDGRADIYALGCVGYELLVGQAPYAGTTAAAVRKAQMSSRPVAPSERRLEHNISPAVDTAILRALALDRDQRFSTMNEFLHDFERASDRSTSSALTTVGHRFAASRYKYASIMLAGTIAIVFALLFIARPNSSRPSIPARPRHAAPLSDTAANTAAIKDEPRKEPQSADHILNSALTAAKRERRRQAITHLAFVSSPASRSKLLAALKDSDSLVRRKAALALGALGGKNRNTQLALRSSLRREMGISAIAVAKALAHLGDRSGLKRLRLEVKRAKNKSPLARRYALEALAEVDRRAMQRLARLEQTIVWQENPALKARVLAILARSGNIASRAELKTQARHGTSDAIREKALLAYADAASRAEALNELSRRQDFSSPSYRAQVLGKRLRLGDSSAEALLIHLTQNNNSSARVHSALELGRSKAMGATSPSNGESLRQHLEHNLGDQNTRARLAAAAALDAFERP